MFLFPHLFFLVLVLLLVCVVELAVATLLLGRTIRAANAKLAFQEEGGSCLFLRLLLPLLSMKSSFALPTRKSLSTSKTPCSCFRSCSGCCHIVGGKRVSRCRREHCFSLQSCFCSRSRCLFSLLVLVLVVDLVCVRVLAHNGVFVLAACSCSCGGTNFWCLLFALALPRRTLFFHQSCLCSCSCCLFSLLVRVLVLDLVCVRVLAHVDVLAAACSCFLRPSFDVLTTSHFSYFF